MIYIVQTPQRDFRDEWGARWRGVVSVRWRLAHTCARKLILMISVNLLAARRWRGRIPLYNTKVGDVAVALYSPSVAQHYDTVRAHH